MPLPHEYIKRPDRIAPVKPWVSSLVLLLLVYMFYQLSVHGQFWLGHNCFSPKTAHLYWIQQKYLPLANMMFWATFCSANLWLLVANSYFFWVFGSTVELRLGYEKYIFLIMTSLFGTWFILSFETGARADAVYIGPGLLTAAVVGAYLVFFPEKKINPGGSIGTTRTVTRRERDPDPSAAFGISPWWLISSFIVYEAVLHFVLTGQRVPVDNMTLMAGGGAFVLGIFVCAGLVAFASHGIAGNPLKILAIERYRQLRALDMSHDESVEGVARLISCPVEQVKQWIAAGSGALPTQNR